MPSDRQLHPTFPEFQRWVLGKLDGIVARDASNAVVFIVGNWIDEHREALREWGITQEAWKEELRRHGEDGQD